MNQPSIRRVVLCPAVIAALLAACGLAAGTAQAGDFTLNGQVFADFTTKSNEDDATGAKSTDSGTGTDVKRFYVQVGYQLDEVWSAHFTSDIGDQTSRRYDVFVKHAYLEAKLSLQADFRLGAADTPWIATANQVYGYRYLEPTLVDRLRFGASADWGVHFQGNQGRFGYAAGLLNGRGFGDTTRSKNPDVEALLTFRPTDHLVVGVGSYRGKLGQEVEGTATFHTASRLNALLAYVDARFRVGGETFTADDYNTITTPGVTDSAAGYSLWFAVPVSQKVEVFGRYDRAEPSRELNPGLRDTYVHAGVQLTPRQNLTFALAYKHEKVDSGLGGKVNGVGSSTPGSAGTAHEVGLWTHFRW